MTIAESSEATPHSAGTEAPPRERFCVHREYLNQFLTRGMASGDRLANLVVADVKKIPQDVFSEDNCAIAEKIAKRFYSSAAFDMGEAPKFFSGQFSDVAVLFLARVFAARCNVAAHGIYGAASAAHDAFVNAWLRARTHGSESAANDALCKPWECVGSAIRKCEDIFICEAVRRMGADPNSLTDNVKEDAEHILDVASYTLKREEPVLCMGI